MGALRLHIFSLSRERRKGGGFSTTRREACLCTGDITKKEKSGGAWVLSCDSKFPMPPLSAAGCRCGLVVLALRVRSYFAFCGFRSAERIHAHSGFAFLQLLVAEAYRALLHLQKSRFAAAWALLLLCAVPGLYLMLRGGIFPFPVWWAVSLHCSCFAVLSPTNVGLWGRV